MSEIFVLALKHNLVDLVLSVCPSPQITSLCL